MKPLISFCFCVICILGVLGVFAFVEIGSPQAQSIYHGNWIDLNKNGRMDRYEDQSASIESRIDDLLSQMNIEEKTAQMATLYGYGRVLKDELPTPA